MQKINVNNDKIDKKNNPKIPVRPNYTIKFKFAIFLKKSMSNGRHSDKNEQIYKTNNQTLI